MLEQLALKLRRFAPNFRTNHCGGDLRMANATASASKLDPGGTDFVTAVTFAKQPAC
jgi:hypothetical protein